MAEEATAAWAALGISIAAMIIALAQAVQQYLITGQLIRLCDSVVFGGLPGQGRRIWQASQFRFRVVYKVPQIGLSPQLWPSSAAQSFADVDRPLPDLTGAGCYGSWTEKISVSDVKSEKTDVFPSWIPAWFKKSSSQISGEVGTASWAAFCLTVYDSCYNSIGYSFVQGDADRCPSDIPTVPMQISLRDAIVMGLMVGMECTAASFDRGSVSMQGAAGTITSAQHPVLGPMIHFTPRKTSKSLGIGYTGIISKCWLWRVMGNCIVSEQQYNWRRRRWVENALGGFRKPRSRRDGDDRRPTGTPGERSPQESRPALSIQSEKMPRDGDWQIVPTVPLPALQIWYSQYVENTTVKGNPQPDFRPPIFSWELQRPGEENARPTYTRMSRKYLSLETLKVFGYDYEFDESDPAHVLINRWVTEPEQDLMWQHTKELREERLREPGYSDTARSVHEEDGNRGWTKESAQSKAPQAGSSYRRRSHSKASTDRSEVEREALEAAPKHDTDREDSVDYKSVNLSADEFKRGLSPENNPHGDHHVEKAPGEEEIKVEMKKLKQLGPYLPRFSPPPIPRLATTRKGDVSWFWLSQTDIIPGFCATPWRSFSDLNPQTCIAAVAVFIEAIEQSMGGANGLRFIEFEYISWDPLLSDTIRVMKRGVCTFPAYAYEADGGVVCAGTYATFSHKAFENPIPVVELLISGQHQADYTTQKSQAACESRIVELMRLDAWLSLVGRTAEISTGDGRLLTQTPALIQQMIVHFQWRFFDADLSSELERNGVYKKLGRAVVAWLRYNNLGEAEMLYAIVAALRTVKVGQAILTGPDTRMLTEIMEKDVQVHLV